MLPLTGIRVLDFTWILAGPSTTRILADFGAEVIKVQSGKMASGTEMNNSHYFATWNRNKLGITLDMKHEKARELALRLAGISDILIHNFTPRVMHNWGLNYDLLSKENQGLIMVNLTGMGMTGPWRDYAALADTVAALSGLTWLTSSGRKTSEMIGFPYADITAGLFAAIAVLTAVEDRNETGKGACLDISELEALCTLLGPSFMSHTHGAIADNGATGYYTTETGKCYKCKGEDRWCVISISNDNQWHKLCRIMGNPTWSKEGRFCNVSGRRKYCIEMDSHIQQWTLGKSPSKIMHLLQKEGIPCGVVNDAADLSRDPQLKYRDYFINSYHPLLGKVKMEGTPLKLSKSKFSIYKAAPLLGEDNDYVFKHLLGLDDDLISQYRQGGIIA